MGIERLTPEDREWTGHSIQAHQRNYEHSALEGYKPFTGRDDEYDPMNPCRTTSLNKPIPLSDGSDNRGAPRADSHSETTDYTNKQPTMSNETYTQSNTLPDSAPSQSERLRDDRREQEERERREQEDRRRQEEQNSRQQQQDRERQEQERQEEQRRNDEENRRQQSEQADRERNERQYQQDEENSRRQSEQEEKRRQEQQRQQEEENRRRQREEEDRHRNESGWGGRRRSEESGGSDRRDDRSGGSDRHDDRSGGRSNMPNPPAPVPVTPTMSRELFNEGKDLAKTTISSGSSIARDTYSGARDAIRNISDGIDNATGNHGNYISRALAPSDALVGAAYMIASVTAVSLLSRQVSQYEQEHNVNDVNGSIRHIETPVVEKPLTLGDYKDTVAETKAFERASRMEEMKTRDAAIGNEQKVIADATKRYDQVVSDIEAKSNSVQQRYEAKVSSIDKQIDELKNNPMVQKINNERQEKLDNVNATYQNNKATMQTERQAELAKITTSTPNAEAARKAINERYDREEQKLDSRHERAVNKVNSDYDKRVDSKMQHHAEKLDSLNNAKQALTQANNERQSKYASQKAGVIAQKESIVNTANENIKQAKEKCNENIAKIKQDTTKQLDTFKKEHKAAEAQYKADKAHAKKMGHDGEKTKGAIEFKQSLITKQNELSTFMATKLGTKEEQDLVNALIKDNKNAAKASKEGKPYTSTLSKEDRDAAAEVLKKYGRSTFDTAADVKQALGALGANANKLADLSKTLNETVNLKQQAVNKLENEKQELINQIGKPLNKMSTAELAKVKELSDKIQQAKNELANAKKEANTTAGALGVLKSQMAQISKHAKKLPKIPNEKLKPTQADKKVIGIVAKSMHGSLAGLNQFAMRNNYILQADKEWSRQLSSLKNSISQTITNGKRAVHISKAATKMVFGVGKFAARGIVIVASRSPMYAATIGKLQAMAAKSGVFSNLGAMGEKMGVARGKLAAGNKAVGKFLGKVGKGASIGFTVLADPFNAPQKLAQHLKKKATEKIVMSAKASAKRSIQAGKRRLGNGVRKAGKGAAKLGKGVGKLGKGVYNRTLGRSKLVNKLTANVKKAGQVGGKVFKKIGNVISAPFRWLKKGLSKIISTLISIVSSIISAVCALLIQAVIASFSLLFFVIALLILLIMLISVLDAILKFWEDAKTENRILIKNDPTYILNIGANYRNVELAILEFFSVESGYTTNDKYNNKIECNSDPIYYAVFNCSFNWFGIFDDGKDINKDENGNRVVNEQAMQALEDFSAGKEKFAENRNWWESLVGAAQSIINAIHAAFSTKSTFGDLQNIAKFKSVVTTYNKASCYYHMGAEGQDSGRLNYEVSNAKDAIAMMDAIYTTDNEMSRFKVLRYLGVGEYQLAKHEVDEGSKKDLLKSDNHDNLFWNSHNVVYAEGTKSSDIKFHKTSSTTGQIIDGSAGANMPYTCDNAISQQYKYIERVWVSGDWGSPMRTYKCDWTYHGSNSHLGVGTKKYGNLYSFECGHNHEIDYGFGDKVYAYKKDGRGYVQEYIEGHYKPENRYVDFEYCLGHVNLVADIYVTVADPDDPTAKNLFDCAQELVDIDKEKVGWSMWTLSADLNISGPGSVVESVYPYEEWSDSSLQALTVSKLQEDIEYELEDDTKLTQMTTTRGANAKYNKLLYQSYADDLLLYGLYFNRNTIYAKQLKSGIQQDIVVRASLSSADDSYGSFKKAASGVSYYQYQFEPSATPTAK